MPITDKTEIAAVSEHLPSPDRSLINTAFFVIIPRLKISEQFNIYLVMLSLYNTTVIICMYNFQNFYRYSLQGVKKKTPHIEGAFSIDYILDNKSDFLVSKSSSVIAPIFFKFASFSIF